jgi:hypothetical protein
MRRKMELSKEDLNPGRELRERLEESYGRDRNMLPGAEEAEEVDGVCVCVCVCEVVRVQQSS